MGLGIAICNQKNKIMTSHTFNNPIQVLLELLRGRTLTRTLFNLAIRNHTIHGKVLDLGAKTTSASYYKFIKCESDVVITHTDLEPSKGVLKIDVEKPFEILDGSYDTVLAFFLFEHVFNFHRAPSEIFRILRPSGRLFVAIPFMHEFHADPDDFVRLTDSGMRRLFEEAGFQCVHMEAIGEGLITMCMTKLPYLVFPRFLRSGSVAFFYLISTIFDRIISLRPFKDKIIIPRRFALAYFAVFEKPQ